MKKNNNKVNWEFSAGFYPGILIGIRSYRSEEKADHVFYLPMLDFCLTIYK